MIDDADADDSNDDADDFIINSTVVTCTSFFSLNLRRNRKRLFGDRSSSILSISIIFPSRSEKIMSPASHLPINVNPSVSSDERRRERFLTADKNIK